MDKKTEKRVLIFDSGVGGLSVYIELKALLPQLEYLYLFDNAAYPYGELDGDTLVYRVQTLITQYCREYDIDLVVIACNTASTLVLPHLRAALSIPIVGVVPAIKPASLISKIGVGLIATPATITRDYTHDLIKDFAKDTEVKLLGSTKLVEMAERKLRSETVCPEEMRELLEPLINQIDVAVLGCTHFPLLKDEISRVLNGVVLIDSGNAIARRVAFLLKASSGLERKQLNRIFCSAPPRGDDALNSTLKKMGFSETVIQPFPGV
ncbi:glutamate racemase [Vibrio sp. S9_S30]|uniref:glutamate racemase n=1 Tax=Vibrio sp. S9_S30 TaxID=2720226 RepID=UPI003139A0BD